MNAPQPASPQASPPPGRVAWRHAWRACLPWLRSLTLTGCPLDLAGTRPELDLIGLSVARTQHYTHASLQRCGLLNGGVCEQACLR